MFNFVGGKYVSIVARKGHSSSEEEMKCTVLKRGKGKGVMYINVVRTEQPHIWEPIPHTEEVNVI